MKYTAIFTLFLACGPSVLMAAPVAQGQTPALSGGHPPQSQQSPGLSAPQGAPAQGSSQGSSSQGMQGQSDQSDGLLGNIEEIIKTLIGSLRKRGIIEEVGDAAKKTLDEANKFVNGDKSGNQSSFSSQSSNPDAAAAPGAQQGSSSGSNISKFIGGRSNDPSEALSGEVPPAPGQNDSPLTQGPPSPAAASLGQGEQENGHSHKHSSSSQGTSTGQFPSSIEDLSPEQLQGITNILTGGSSSAKPQIPGLA